MKTKTQKPKLKPRRMWANQYIGDNALYLHPSLSIAMKRNCGLQKPSPVAVIPLDDVNELIGMAAHAHEGWTKEGAMRAALIAIGVLPKVRKGRK